MNESGGSHIGEIREEIRSFPIIYAAIEDKKAKFCTGMDYLKISVLNILFPRKIIRFNCPDLHWAICFGYICSTQLEEEIDINEKLLDDMTTFGNMIGQLIMQARNSKKRVFLASVS